MYDPTNGGFGHAPKFPQVPILYFTAQHNPSILQHTLAKMAQSGIYDHLAGGFFRYSVDAKWQIPHFEKMLYDNGLLLALYAQHGSREYDNLLRTTADWIITDMRSPTGGFYASLDADSDGHEGMFYVWDVHTIETALERDEFYVARLYFGLDQSANFEKNKWHLTEVMPLSDIAHDLHISVEIADQRLQSAKQKLLHLRQQRTSPSRDEKILTAWNALTIKGLLLTGDKLACQQHTDIAQQSIDFIRQHLWINKRLFASFQQQEAKLNGYLDDYVFLLDALLTSLQVKWRSEDLDFCTELADAILTHFSDKVLGGFYFTSDDHEKLLYRPKTSMDDAIPSSNGIAAQALQTLGYLVGNTQYLQAAEKTLQSTWQMLSQYPAEHSSLLLALDHYLQPHPIVVIRGSNQSEIEAWRKYCWSPQHFIVAIPVDATLPEALVAKLSSDKTCAYICTGMQCSPVITDIHDLRRQLSITAQ